MEAGNMNVGNWNIEIEKHSKTLAIIPLSLTNNNKQKKVTLIQTQKRKLDQVPTFKKQFKEGTTATAVAKNYVRPKHDFRYVMKTTCIVPTCTSNTQTNRYNSNITFYLFPKGPDLRKAWVEALGIPSSAVNDKSMICSEHFTEDSFYKTKHGWRVHTLALPTLKLDLNASALMMVCRICLAHHPKMQSIREFSESFEAVTGIPASEDEALRLPQCLCWECAARLTAAASFRAKALLSDGLLRDLLKPDKYLRIRDIKRINRHNFGLATTLVQNHFDSNHYDVLVNDTFVEINNMLDFDLPEEIKEVKIDEDTPHEEKVNNYNVNHNIYEEHNYGTNLNTENKIDNTENSLNENIDFANIDTDYEISVDEFDIFNSDTEMDEDNFEASESINSFNIEDARNKKKRTVDSQNTIPSDDEASQPKRIKKNITTAAETTSIKETIEDLFIVTPLSYEQQAAGAFECYICKIRKENRSALVNHISSCHSREFKCRKCNFVTRRRKLLSSHKNLHEGGKFKCHQCSIVFSYKTSYLTHLRRIHITDHVCNRCGYAFLNRLGVVVHLRTQHKHDKGLKLKGPYCEKCDIKFLSEEAYARHLRVSSKHLKSENDPSRIYNYRTSTNSFRSRKTDESSMFKYPYVCEQCGDKFTKYGVYTDHFSHFHPNVSPTRLPVRNIQVKKPDHPNVSPTQLPVRNVQVKKPENATWMCDQCGKVYKAKCNLEFHILAHAGCKMFQCDYCGRSFGARAALISHIKSVHEGGPPHKCQHCDKRFFTSSSLKKHMGIHLGVKLECKICGKTFTNSDGLNNHVKHVHNKVPRPKKTKGKVKKENDEE